MVQVVCFISLLHESVVLSMSTSQRKLQNNTINRMVLSLLSFSALKNVISSFFFMMITDAVSATVFRGSGFNLGQLEDEPESSLGR